MSRHIKVEGALVKENSDAYNRVEVTIREQTHFGFDFGLDTLEHKWRYGSRGFVHKNIRLYSDSLLSDPYGCFTPTDTDGEVNLWCNLLNSNLSPSRSFRVTLDLWELIKEAVNAYNDYFKEVG